MKPITFVLFTRNESARIAYAVRNFIQHGPVLVVDGGSTDDTCAQATALGATVVQRPETDKPFVENQENLNLIRQHITTDYIYWGYVDNTAPQPLVERLLQLATEGRYKRVTVPLWTYLWGETRYPAQHSHLPVLFHKDFIDFTDNTIHCFGKFLGTPQEDHTLSSKPELTLRHFSTYTEAKYVAAFMRYAEMEAKQKYEKGERFSLLKLFAAMTRYVWIYRRALRSPRLGILIVSNMAFGRLMTYTRLYEYQHGITLSSVEQRYSNAKEQLLDAHTDGHTA